MGKTNLKDTWLRILTDVYPRFGRAYMITYFKNSAILGIEHGNLIIGVPRSIFLNWHLENSKAIIFDVAKKIIPDLNEVIFQVVPELEGDDNRGVNTIEYFPKENKGRKLPKRPDVKLPNGITSQILNPKYRLANFVIGDNNSMAHAVAEAIAKKPGDKYNPFFLYGKTGLGKTHLLQAIGNEVIVNFPESIVIYVTSEMFMNEVVGSIQKRQMEKFRKKYRQVDVLIIDDIQFLAGRGEKTAEEFFHTFNTLREAGKQIIIASDRPPKELDGLEERLVSRFESGMTAEIKQPDYETRLAILYNKAQDYQSLIPGDVFEFIAMNVTSSIRELEGVLMQIAAMIELQHKTPDLKQIGEFIKQVNKDIKLVGFEEKMPVLIKNMEDVIGYVADYFNLNISDILGKARTKDVMYPRQLAMYIIKEKLGQSLMKIGEYFGGRDHTSVLHSVNKIALAIKNKDQIVKKDLKNLYKEMGIG
ncbi:chromosomal replication initiator protein DnaA [Candidatus Gracilibacteria bacterium]|nr:chromosomal replication initiator protein DnaA [Candidatus Gracilibacteria bacterium]